MPICQCSTDCEHYVPSNSKTGMHRNCQARIGRWKSADIGQALEYARKLEVRRGTLSYVVSSTQVAQAAIAKRKEIAENERKEREKAEKERARRARQRKQARVRAQSVVDARKKGRAR